MDQGHVEEMIIKQSARSGLPLPEKIENSPSILPGLELYYKGFLDLHTSRPSGFDLGSIPWLAIEQYCQIMKLDADQTEAMHHHIVEMDKVFLKHHKRKNKNANP